MGRDNILLVSYDFPPALAGVRRVVKFAKYLPEFGYNPIVLAATAVATQPLDPITEEEVAAQGYPVYRTSALDLNHAWASMVSLVRALRRGKEWLIAKLDMAKGEQTAPNGEGEDELLAHSARLLDWPPIGEEIKLEGRAQRWARRLAYHTRRWLYLPDDRVGWLPLAIPMAEHILATRPVRFVFTTSYPNSTHFIGRYLKRRYRVFWIADFRDGWTTNPYFADYPTPLHRALNKRWERSVATEADLLLTVSEPIAIHLREICGDPAKVRLIPNGFDPDDFPSDPPQPNDKFTLVYTGTLFGQRSPEPLFAAMRILFDKHPKMEDEFQVVLLTQLKPEHLALIKRYGLSGKVLKGGKLVTYREAVRAQWQADALLAIEGPAPTGEMMLTQKVFEYMAAGKPVLAITPENALAQVVRETGIGCVVAPDDIEQLVARLFELFTGTFPFRPRYDMIIKYHRRTQASTLASVLDELRKK